MSPLEPNFPPCSPLTEDKLTANWATDAPVAVTVCSITFNQAEFIAKALDGMLSQRLPEPFEIIIHDDASTDGTREIVQDYATRYPRIVRAVLPERNRYSQGISIFAEILPLAKGRYVALCEGDDYWLGRDKLAVQAKFLDATPDCDICSHHFIRFQYDSSGQIVSRVTEDGSVGRYDAQYLFDKSKARFPTATVMMRRSTLDTYLNFSQRYSYIRMEDIYMKFFAARSGGIELLPGTFAVYRAQAPNSWSSSMRRSKSFKLANSRAKVNSYRALADMAGPEQRQAIERAIRQEIEALMRSRYLSPLDRVRYLRDVGVNTRNLRSLASGLAPLTIRRLYRWLKRTAP